MKFDLDFIRDCFDIDFSKGTLSWKADRPTNHFRTLGGYSSWKTRFSSTKSVTKNGKGYFCVGVTFEDKYITHTHHRIIYALFHNDPSPPLIDHYNRDITDNRISNLRPSCKEGNAKNRKLSKLNTSGITGIKFIVKKSGYCFWLTNSSKPTGPRKLSFNDFFQACCERKAWEIINGYTTDHGKIS